MRYVLKYYNEDIILNSLHDKNVVDTITTKQEEWLLPRAHNRERRRVPYSTIGCTNA